MNDNVTIDKGARLVGDQIEDVLRCVVRTERIKIKSQHGRMSIPTNQITGLHFFRASIFGVHVDIYTTDGSVFKGKLITTNIRVDYPSGINASGEVDCRKLSHISGEIPSGAK
jgi:hypothetical protein